MLNMSNISKIMKSRLQNLTPEQKEAISARKISDTRKPMNGSIRIGKIKIARSKLFGN